MTLTLTVIDDNYGNNTADGTKTARYTGSFTNPYTAGGEVIDMSALGGAGGTLFPTKFLGGAIEAINASVAVNDAGTLAASAIRGGTSSTSSCVLQLFNCGLSATNKAGLFVDNTVANISSYTATIRLTGY